jgi:hypothetical protein
LAGDPIGAVGAPALPQDPEHLLLTPVDLQGERAVQVLARSVWLYVRTAEGGIWGWGWRDSVFCGIYGSEEDNGEVPELTCVDTVLCDGLDEWKAPPFALMAADEFHLVAVDRHGRLYAAGEWAAGWGA